MSFLYPGEYIDSTYSIDFDKLYKEGYRGIIFDIDNTLVTHGSPADERAIALFKHLKELGFLCLVLSNNKEPRVKSFAKQVGIKYIYKAGKPKPSGYRTAMERLGTDTKNTLFVGDQIFTDIIGANLTGIRSILVAPIDPHEEIQIVLKRFIEKKGRLDVKEAIGIGVQIAQGMQQLCGQTADLSHFLPQIQPDIQCNLVIPGTGGVVPLAHIPQPLGQLCLHEHVDILRRGIQFQFPGFQIRQDPLQPLYDLSAVLFRDDAAVPQHGGMGDTALNVMPVHTGIKCDRGVKRIYACVNFFGKSSCPKCHI